MLPFSLGPTHSQPCCEVQAAIQRPVPAQTPLPSMPPGTPISCDHNSRKCDHQPYLLFASLRPVPCVLPRLPLCLQSLHMSLSPSPRPRLTPPKPLHPKEVQRLKMWHLAATRTYHPHPSLDIMRQATLSEPAANPCQHEHPCDHERLSHSCGRVLANHLQQHIPALLRSNEQRS